MPGNGDDEFDVADLAGALAQTQGLSFGWGTVDDDLTMTVILNALKEQTNANILLTYSVFVVADCLLYCRALIRSDS